jgi:hypothetical protein
VCWSVITLIVRLSALCAAGIAIFLAAFTLVDLRVGSLRLRGHLDAAPLWDPHRRLWGERGVPEQTEGSGHDGNHQCRQHERNPDHQRVRSVAE